MHTVGVNWQAEKARLLARLEWLKYERQRVADRIASLDAEVLVIRQVLEANGKGRQGRG